MDKKKWIPTQDAWLHFEGNVCTDIKVSTPGTSVRLEAPEFALRNCKRSFPGVKALIIPKGVKKIDIPNSLFPNVEHVISDSDKFLNYRIRKINHSCFLKILIFHFLSPFP